jgi:predicted DNA binding CopG/RHH family protein
MIFEWNENKNSELKKERSICFERIVVAIEENDIIDILEHPNKDKYKSQYLILVNIDNYVYVVPSIINEDKWFLKTIFPSRKYTKVYLKG